MIPGVCRVCGCSDDSACLLLGGTRVPPQEELALLAAAQRGEAPPDGLATCSWVEPDLCTGCVTPAPPPLLFDAYGAPLRGAP